MLRHLALITHAVPPERLQKHLPKGFEVDPWIVKGKPRALISVGCFRNEEFRWNALERPSLDFEQCTYRAYVRYKGVRGAYFFGTYLGTTLSWAMVRSLAAGAKRASFEIVRNYNDSGYRRYSGAIHARGTETRFEIKAVDLPSNDELTQFLTHRMHGFFKTSLGAIWDQPVEHAPMRPFAGKLVSGRFDPWEQLDLISAEEAERPYSVLVQPAIHFLVKPPMPLSELGPEAERTGESRAA